MRLIIPFAALLLAGCNTLSTALVLTASASLPGAYPPLPERCDACQAEGNEADALARRVPTMMEQSRLKAGPQATATRTGYYSWEVSTVSSTVGCKVTPRGWRCDRELGPVFSQQL